MSNQNLSEAEKKFLAFDWSKSQEWQTYFSNLYPTPDASKVPKFKRTWFRRNVDSTLSLESTVGNVATQNTQTKTEQPKETTPKETKWPKLGLFDRLKNRPNISLLQELLLRLELVLLLGYVFSTVVVLTSRFKTPGSDNLLKNCETVSKSFSLLYLLVGLLREKGKPQFNSAWFSALSNDNRAHYLMYGLFFIRYPTKFVYTLPQLVTALLLLSSMYKSFPSVFPTLMRTNKVKELLMKVENNKYLVYKFRAYLECSLVPYLALCLFTGRTNMVPLFLYFSFLRMKVHSNDVYLLNNFKTLHSTAINTII
uniref:Transmembrane protein 33 n=1 Tax=Theileria annulata TaxID=5874 RepID=A0A3B0N6Z3_THEAN